MLIYLATYVRTEPPYPTQASFSKYSYDEVRTYGTYLVRTCSVRTNVQYVNAPGTYYAYTT